MRYSFFVILCSILIGSTLYSETDADNGEKKDEKQSYPLNVKFAVGTSITGGNNSTRVATLNSEFQKRYTRFRIRLNGRGAYGEASYADGPWIESTNNWLFSTRIDWFTTSQLHTFLFTEGTMQSNQYRGYWLKNSVQGGYGIALFSEIDHLEVNLPLGIDYAREILVVDDSQRPEKFSAVLKPEMILRLNSNIRYRLKTNIFVDLKDEEEYRIDSENVIDVKLTDKFSLRTAYTINYNNTPRLIREVDQSGTQTGNRVPAKPADHLFSTSLLVSF